jgi:hypothetical protein
MRGFPIKNNAIHGVPSALLYKMYELFIILYKTSNLRTYVNIYHLFFFTFIAGPAFRFLDLEGS